jgi:hypothetical protein
METMIVALQVLAGWTLISCILGPLVGAFLAFGNHAEHRVPVREYDKAA